MSQQNQGNYSSPSADPPVKRKRGRPRKDENLVHGENTTAVPGSDSAKKIKANASTSDGVDEMVGQVVTGVIEGTFDSGYLLNVKVGDMDTQLRGLVFLPGRVTPITAANDVAPHVRMYKRKELPIPVFSQSAQNHGSVLPSPQSGKEPELNNDAGISPDHTPRGETQSGVQADQAAHVMVPMVGNFTRDKTGPSLEENVIPQGLENQATADMAQMQNPEVGQVKIMQGSEASTVLMKGPEPAAKPLIYTSPITEAIIPDPQVQHQTLSCDLKPNDLILDEVKSSKLVNQTFTFPEPNSVPSEQCSKAVDTLMEREASLMKDVLQNAQGSVSAIESVDIPMGKQDSPIKDVPQNTENYVFGEPKFALPELINNPVDILMEKQESLIKDMSQVVQKTVSAEISPVTSELIEMPIEILKGKKASPNTDVSQYIQNCVSAEPKSVPFELNNEPADIVMEHQASPVNDSPQDMQNNVFGEANDVISELIMKPADLTKDAPRE